MRIRFGGKRRRREALITERLDGALDAAGERELAEAAAADPELARDIVELEAATALLREQPQQAAPRSFALSAPPQPAPVPGAGLLQWTQAAAAAAVLALVVLTGADLAGLGAAAGPEPVIPDATVDGQAAPVEDAEMEGPAEAGDQAVGFSMAEPAGEPLLAPTTTPMPFAAGGAESAQRGDSKTSDTEAAPKWIETEETPAQTVGTETRGAAALRRAQWAAGAAAVFLVLGSVVLRRRAATRWR